jgi:putative transposase
MSTDYSINALCAALNVSRSGYPAWRTREPGARAQTEAVLLPLIAQTHEQSRRTYGSPRVTRVLRELGHRCGHNHIARLMRGAGLRSRPRARFRVCLTDSNHDLPIAPNLLLGRAPAERSDPIWLSDITYVRTGEGWLYLAGMVDRYSRRCIGWAMGDSLATSLPLAALEVALTQRQPPRGLVHHSDRGVQYASEAYRQRLAAAGVIPSMSRRGNCSDNAIMESFWSSLKRELVHRCEFATRAEAQAAIFEWLEVFYNRERLPSALGYKSPVDFETHLN